MFLYDGKEVHLAGSGEEKGLTYMRNVSGEIIASMKAMQYAKKNNIKSLTIVHDYQGISSWCIGEWKTKNTYTMKYKEYYEKVSKHVDIRFSKVKGHSNDFFNDVADALAKSALGIKVSGVIRDYLDGVKNKMEKG